MDSDISEKLNEVLSDPEKLKGVMSLASTLMSQTSSGEKTAESLADTHPPSPVQPDRRGELLRALKPFLSGERRDRIDKILRIITLAGVAELFNDDNRSL